MPAGIIAVLLYVSLILWLFCLCGRYTADYAARRGRSTVVWFILGGLFYPLPYLVLALLPPRQRPA